MIKTRCPNFLTNDVNIVITYSVVVCILRKGFIGLFASAVVVLKRIVRRRRNTSHDIAAAAAAECDVTRHERRVSHRAYRISCSGSVVRMSSGGSVLSRTWSRRCVPGHF